MKQPYVIVLAGNSREGIRYAKRAGLTKGRYRVVFSAKQIRRLRSAEIHELPSFRRRPDRHSINAALRYTRGERLQVTMPELDAPPTPAGPTLRELEVAYRYNDLRDTPALDAVAELAKGEATAELEAILEPEGWEPPETLTAEQVLQLAANPDARGADVIDQGDGLGPQIDIDGDEHPVKSEPKKRRKRCALCQELVFGDDDPAHDAAAHEVQDAKILGKPNPRSLFGG